MIAAGVKTSRDNLGRYDFDLVNRLQTPLIRQTFLLSNQSNLPLANLRLHFAHPGRLTVLAARQDGAGLAPQPVLEKGRLPTLPPAQELFLYVTLDLAAVPPGDVNESIDITAPDHTRAVARLEMTGSVLPAITFSPSVLDFGKVPATQTRSGQLTLSIDPRLAPSGALPHLYCSNPDVQVQPVPLDPRYTRTSPLLNARQKTAGLFTYLLTLSDQASVGTVRGTLFVASVTPPNEPDPKAPKLQRVLSETEVANALHSVSAAVTGTVRGDVAALPAAIVFGAVLQGKEAIQRVMLIPRTNATLDGVQISSPVPWLAARWAAPEVVPLRPDPKANMARPLEVILRADAPAGRLEAQLILTLTNGQRLVVPVSATVRQTKAAITRPGNKGTQHKKPMLLEKGKTSKTGQTLQYGSSETVNVDDGSDDSSDGT